MGRSAFWLSGLSGVLALAAGVGACSAGGSSGGDGFGGSSQSSNSLGSNSGGSGSGFNPTISGSGASTASGNTDCNAGPDEDKDGDGWTIAEGDCNDCDPNVNPGAIEVIAAPGDGGTAPAADENCDGKVDNVAPPCDSGLALDDTTPASGAKAIGICQVASVDGTRGKPGYSYGLMSAAYVLANGNALSNPGKSVGIMPNFGPNVNPQEGANMLVMSSGHARTEGQDGACGMDSCSTRGPHQAPPGFPAKVTGCPGGTNSQINDDVALQLELRAPTNATGYSFKFKFHSFEFPEWVCTEFNDQFIALVNPPPTGAINGNISFDSKNNPVSVNIAFFDVCSPGTAGQWAENCGSGNCPPIPSPYCPSGPAQLQGTGFEGVWSHDKGGGTSWLQTEAPITGGEEFTIRFAIWDTNDHALDSTVLIDGFEWIAGSGVSIGTGKVPVPK